MEPHSAIGKLMHEHRLILRGIDDIRREAERIRRDGHIDENYIGTIVDFLSSYADRCHHGKEEDILFRALEDKPMSDELAGDMRRLIEDHIWARAEKRLMAEAAARFIGGDQTARAAIIDAMEAFVAFYPDHIEREDHGFFKPAIELFTPQEREELVEEFEAFDRELFHERYRGIVEDLEVRRREMGE